MSDITLAARLDAAVRAVFPNIVGVRIGKPANRATWGVCWPDGHVPTESDLQTVSQLISTFDATPPPPAKTLEERIVELEQKLAKP